MKSDWQAAVILPKNTTLPAVGKGKRNGEVGEEWIWVIMVWRKDENLIRVRPTKIVAPATGVLPAKYVAPAKGVMEVSEGLIGILEGIMEVSTGVMRVLEGVMKI